MEHNIFHFLNKEPKNTTSMTLYNCIPLFLAATDICDYKKKKKTAMLFKKQ